MKVGELLELVEKGIGKLTIKLVDVQNRVFESPHTAWEFNQRSLELQDDLDKLKKTKAFLEKYDKDEIVEKIFTKEELEKLLAFLRYAAEADIYEP